MWHRDVRGVAHSFPEIVLGDAKPAILAVTLAAALLLLITCVNVANLLLVRALRRTREFAVRSALGAKRRGIVMQLLTENALLSVVGGLLGVTFAMAAVRVFVAVAPADFPRVDEVGINAAALVAALLITTAAMLLSGLGPALLTSRVDVQAALRAGSRHSRGRRVRAIAEGLVVTQVALAAVSLSAAGLMTRSLINLVQVDLSFEPARLLVAELVLQHDHFEEPQRWIAEIEPLLPRLEALPGVERVSPVLAAPFSGGGGGIDGRLSTPGQSQEEAAGNPMVNMEVVAPNYFATLGIPVLHGRPFSAQDRDSTEPVVIVSSSTARYLWPNEDPIGKRVRAPGGEAEVVGIVPDTRYRELQTARPSVYIPLGQSRFPVVPNTLLIRTTGPALAVVPALRRAIAVAQPGITLVTASSVETLLDRPRAQPRLNAIVIVLFAAAAVSLAGIGLFAIIATMVKQRTHEIGIRLALGATTSDVRRMIMARGVGMAVLGSVIGVACALATSRLLSALLFEISPTDAPTLGAVVALIVGVAAIATSIPAREAIRIDPIVALRDEA